MHTDAQECTRMRMGKNNTTFGGKQHSTHGPHVELRTSSPTWFHRQSFHFDTRGHRTGAHTDSHGHAFGWACMPWYIHYLYMINVHKGVI